MWHLTRLAIQRRAIMLALVVLLIGASLWALLSMKMELIPDIQFPFTTVVTVYPQASPDDVASKVTTPIERVIWERGQTEGLKHLTSTSAEGVSVIFAEFEYGTDMDQVIYSLRQDFKGLDLPPEVVSLPLTYPSMKENPRIVPINMNIMPLVVLSFSGDIPLDQLKDIADAKIGPILQDIKGVLNVEIEGGEKEQIVIAPDPTKMIEFDISASQIAGLLSSEYGSLSDIESTSLETNGIVLSDIASIYRGPAPNSAVTRTNGKPSLTITVTKESEANTVNVANAVVARADELRKSIGGGVELIPVFDQSEFIEESINTLVDKALIGGSLAIIIVFLFLMAIRASLVTAISIPLSMLFGFLLMRAFGITINILTLSAISISVGRLIDDSIVMVEVIYRRIQGGEGFREAAIGGAREVANPITSATLATVAIFIPLMFVGGIVGQMFMPFALTITFTMLASLLVALMVVPALSNFMVSKNTKKRISRPWYQKLYVPILKWALSHRAFTLIIALVLFLGSMGLLPIIGTSFMSGMSEKQLFVDIQMPPGTDIVHTIARVEQVEALIDENGEFKNYYSTIGTSTSLMGAMTTASGGGDNTAQITINLDSGADMDKEAETLSIAVTGLADGTGIAVATSESHGGGGFGSSGVEISIQGEDYDALTLAATDLIDRLKGVKGLTNLESDATRVVSKLSISPNPDKATALGLSTAQLFNEYSLLVMGSSVPGVQVNSDGRSYPVFIKGVAQGLRGVEQAESLRIGWPESIALGEVAEVQLLQRPTHISHTDTMRSVTISGAVTGKDVGAINRAIQKQIDALPAHPGVDVKIGGVAEEMQETFSRMGIAILAAIVIAFLIVVLMMRSILNPIIIMLSLPLASIGAMLGLIIGGHTLGMSAMMGMLMLVGIVLTNAIVLIVLVEQLRKSGLSSYDALMQGGETRLRPILMTALTTIFAMVPLALGVGSGTILAAELAVVVIGGMFSSTMLTLLVIPVIYSLTDRFRKKHKA